MKNIIEILNALRDKFPEYKFTITEKNINPHTFEVRQGIVFSKELHIVDWSVETAQDANITLDVFGEFLQQIKENIESQIADNNRE